MDTIFWYFLKNVETKEVSEDPIYSEKWVGDIGDYIFIKGIEYEIVDYAEENVYWSDLICE